MPTPSPTTTPFFASDEEALAAAEEVYREYLAMSDLMSSEGGAEPERIAPFVTEEHRDRAVGSFDSLSDSHLRTEGASSISDVSVTYADNFEVQLKLCLDVSNVHVLTLDGEDITPADRSPSVLLVILFEIVEEELLIASSEIGGSAC